METAVAGVKSGFGHRSPSTINISNLEKSTTVNRKVQCVISRSNAALPKQLVDILGINTDTSTASHQVAKFRPGIFEAKGADIGDVVGRGIQITGGGIDATQADAHGHDLILFAGVPGHY